MPNTQEMVRKPKSPVCSVDDCGRPMVRVGGPEGVWVCVECDQIIPADD